MMKKFDIIQFSPCSNAVKYYDKCSTSEEAWNNCNRGDWMLWVAAKLKVDSRAFALAKAYCLNTIRHLIRNDNCLRAMNCVMTHEEVDNFHYNFYINNPVDYSAYVADAMAYFHCPAAFKIKNQLETANICRKYLTEAIFKRVKDE